MRALTIAHHFDYDPGLIGVAAGRHGIELVMAAREDDELPDPLDYDVVISLGSKWSVAAGDAPDAVKREQEFLRHAHDSDVPVLGICFGAQQLAVALGGSVVRSATPEIGMTAISSIDSAKIAPGPWLEFHLDEIMPPAAADVIGRTTCVQAFRLGRSLGVQFHPEATSATVARWLQAGADAYLPQVGLTPERLLADIEANAADAPNRADDLFAYFLESGGISS